MGTTAAADARTAISVCTAHNMDSIDKLTQDYLNTYMSLVAIGGTGGKGATSGKDASDSKRMTLQATGDKIDYWYRRGDAVLYGVIDLVAGTTTWSTNLKDAKRFNSLAQGLKVSGSATTTGTITSAAAGVGTLGLDATKAVFPTK